MSSLIGPHEGKEFELLQMGDKNVALFYEIIPEEYYIFRNNPNYNSIEFIRPATLSENLKLDIQYVILYRIGFEVDANRLHALVSDIIPKEHGMNHEYEREVGIILGYSEEAIDYYLNKNS